MTETAIFRHRIVGSAYAGGALVLVLAVMTLLAGCKSKDADSGSGQTATATQPAAQPALAEVRLGYFGNLTHAQAVLGVASGEFADAIKPATLKTKVFNAGPSFIEALLANQIDIGYVGPGPTLNAFVKTHGEGIRVLSGAAANGVLIVAAKDSGINTLEDLKGKRVATPQPGNTQDIAAKYFLTHNLHQEDTHNVLSFDNSQQAGLMERGEIDASWAPEPWGSRLVAEAGAHVVAEEKDIWPNKEFVLTLVVTSPEFLKAHPEVVRQILGVHHAWTVRLKNDPEKFVPQLEDGLFAVNQKRLPKGVLQSSIKTVKFLDDPLPDTLKTMAEWAYELKLSPHPPKLDGLVDTSVIDSVKSADGVH